MAEKTRRRGYAGEDAVEKTRRRGYAGEDAVEKTRLRLLDAWVVRLPERPDRGSTPVAGCPGAADFGGLDGF